MVIRFALEKDINQIIELCRLHAEYEQAIYDATDKTELLLEHIFVHETIKCLVVEVDSSIVGYATFMKQFSTWDVCYYIYLDCLFIKEDDRGEGVGTKIMEEIKQYAKSEGCSIIQWQTPSFNTKAIKFYNKLGAKPKDKERFTWSI